jgi:hypothetical protein
MCDHRLNDLFVIAVESNVTSTIYLNEALKIFANKKSLLPTEILK